MSVQTKIAIWNANGLASHSHEIKIFLSSHEIDIMLISETHFTDKSYLKIQIIKSTPLIIQPEEREEEQQLS